MRIGILTYHRTLNYGGCMQALAIRLVLEKMGHEVYYVDYWPKYHKDVYSVFSFGKLWRIPDIKGKLRYVINTMRYARFILKRQKNFEQFHNIYTLPYCRPLNEIYDVIIYGSDQIWRRQVELDDYNPVYFGQNDFNAKKNVAFSASMGILPENTRGKERIKELVSQLDNLAVRELDLKDLLESLGYHDVIQTIDPTLLVDLDDWNKCFPLKPFSGKKYILVYALNAGTFNMKSIDDFAKRKGLMVKVLTGNAHHADTEIEITTAGPQDFISLIRNAEYVFSSSFHGLAFSLIFQKEVFASFSVNVGRAKTLLDAAGISSHYLVPNVAFDESIPRIDYAKVNLNLERLKLNSFEYLSKL